MKRLLSATTICLAMACVGRADLVRERWGGQGTPCTRPGTLKVVQGAGGPRLVFDLSAIPPNATVHHASLYCFTEDDDQPTEPPLLLVAGRVDADGKASATGEPLRLEAPWYRSFDATQPVKRWVASPERNLGLVVARFDRLLAGRSYLEVLCEGTARNLPEQASGLRVAHHDGQTFVAWTEVAAFRPRPDEVIWVGKFSENGDTLAKGPGQGAFEMPNHPAITLRTLRRLQGLGLRDQPSGFQGIRPLKRVREVPAVTYRVYRHTERITAANVHRAERLAEVEPLSGYDQDVYTIHFRGEYIDQREEPSSVIPTYCPAKGKALTPGEGLYVHTPKAEGRSFYAVTTALAGTENLSQLTDANSLAEPVAETPATPQPVLQWMQEDRYRKDVSEYWYRYWAAPPVSNLPGRSFRVAVAEGHKFQPPGPLIIGSISGAFNVRGSLNVPAPTAITILIKRQLDWLPALFYNEGRGTLRGMTACKVDYFSDRYMAFLIQWIMGRYRIDRSQISGGLLHFGLRHPEIFTRMSFGSYTAAYDQRWAPGGPRMPSVLGPKGIQTTRGEDAWAMYSVADYVNTYPDRDIPFLVCVSGTGKDGGHTSEFGWQDDPRGWAGLLRARQPFVAAWSLGPPRELTQAFSRMRWDLSLPAFSRCSLDNHPGNGDPADGDFYGCVNGWLLWGDQDQVDQPGRWEMTVWLIASCPEPRCTVDVTPRHCRRFKPRPGQAFAWTNSSLADHRQVQSGRVIADRWGLVTLPGVEVSKGRNRLVIHRP